MKLPTEIIIVIETSTEQATWKINNPHLKSQGRSGNSTWSSNLVGVHTYRHLKIGFNLRHDVDLQAESCRSSITFDPDDLLIDSIIQVRLITWLQIARDSTRVLLMLTAQRLTVATCSGDIENHPKIQAKVVTNNEWFYIL